MLTDIFAYRYAGVPLWEEVEEETRRLLVQGFRIVSEQLYPYWNSDGKIRLGAPELWDGLNKQLAMELGLKDLSPPTTSYPFTWGGRTTYANHVLPKVAVCENFVCSPYDGSVAADRFVKERLSFIEIAFRKKGQEIEHSNSNLSQDVVKVQLRARDRQRYAAQMPGTRVLNHGAERAIDNEVKRVKNANAEMNRAFQASCAELNARLGQAGVSLNYHNGFIQISQDERLTDEVENPFWKFVSAPKWKNVDTDMKEAIDIRDNGGRDPAWYASRALESTVKIISDEKGWTRGDENGPVNYVENLGAKRNRHFIADWERDSLCGFFKSVRRSLGHGSGKDPMPKLTTQQTNWAIEFCMIWIKSLIQRT